MQSYYLNCPYCGYGNYYKFKDSDVTKVHKDGSYAVISCKTCEETLNVRFSIETTVVADKETLKTHINENAYKEIKTLMTNYCGRVIETTTLGFFGKYNKVYMDNEVYERVKNNRLYLQLSSADEMGRATTMRVYPCSIGNPTIKLVWNYEEYNGWVERNSEDAPKDIVKKYIDKYLIRHENF